MNKSRFEVILTSYGRNESPEAEIKKDQEKANNNPRYRFVAIKKLDLKSV